MVINNTTKYDEIWNSVYSNGFKRTMTLGYGDECCNYHYELTGECPIRPEGKLK